MPSILFTLVYGDARKAFCPRDGERNIVMVCEITSAEFMPKVLAADKKVMVEFFATWCPHCRKMEPILDELAAEEAAKATVYRIDVDKNPELGNTYAPNGFPTFVVFDQGEVVRLVTGEQTLEYLRGMLDF